jgi:UDP-galactopyranose mutase
LWENRVLSWVDGEWRQWPPSQEYVDEVAPGWAPQPRGDAANFEEAALAAWPRPIYEKFMKGYTEKQWGVPATEVLASVAGRFVVAERGDTRFKPQTLQGLPGEGGFARMMQRMAEGIHVLLGVDWLKDRGAYQPRKALVFTGPVDAYFAWQAGRLEYRCQRRVHEHVDAGPGEFVQPAPVLNFPGRDVPWVRRIEWKRWMPGGASKWIRDSVLTTEMPDRAEHQDEFEYPVPTAANAQRAKAYRALAHGERQRDVPVYICGRLGDYRYYDMDQAVARAHMLATEILGVDDSGYWTDMTGSEL